MVILVKVAASASFVSGYNCYMYSSAGISICAIGGRYNCLTGLKSQQLHGLALCSHSLTLPLALLMDVHDVHVRVYARQWEEGGHAPTDHPDPVSN